MRKQENHTMSLETKQKYNTFELREYRGQPFVYIINKCWLVAWTVGWLVSW
jgi:hypothetical protein